MVHTRTLVTGEHRYKIERDPDLVFGTAREGDHAVASRWCPSIVNLNGIVKEITRSPQRANQFTLFSSQYILFRSQSSILYIASPSCSRQRIYDDLTHLTTIGRTPTSFSAI